MIDSPSQPRLSRQPHAEPCVRKTPRILLAEDDEEMRAVLRFALAGAGYDVVDCDDGMCLAEHVSSAVLLAEEPAYDLVITDLRLPGISGLSVLEALNACPSPPPRILITAFGDAATHARAKELGVIATFDKPFELDALLEVVADLLGRKDDAA